MKYGSGQGGGGGQSPRRSKTVMTKTRERTKRLAQSTMMEGETSLTFADFGSAFGGADFGSAFGGGGSSNNSAATATTGATTITTAAPAPAPSRRHRHYHNQQPTATSSGSASSLFDEDPFAFKPATESSTEFQAEWPSNHQSMQTLPSNSSMQASYTSAHHQSPTAMQTPERPSRYVGRAAGGSASPLSPQPMSPSHASGGGAAARRKMRYQMRKGTSSGSSHRGDSVERHQQSQSTTPPQSPYSMKRYHSSESVGSRGKPTDHVANYSVSHQQQQRGGGGTPNSRHRMISADRSVGSARSVTSSNSSSEVNLFDSHNGAHGFTFDAFGLDASQMNREVSEAMHDIAGSNPDLSFFFNQDPGDDFAPSRGWDSASPAGSRSSTPEPQRSSNPEGFVDGFRVTKPLSQTDYDTALPILPVHVRESPTSTERSSLTGSSNSEAQDGRRNLFKEKASKKKYRIVRPEEQQQQHPEQLKKKASGQPPQQQKRSMPSMPDLERDRHFASMPKRRDEEEQFMFAHNDAFGSTATATTAASSTRTTSPPRPVSDTGATSDSGALSDVGVSSDFAPPASTLDGAGTGKDILADLKESRQRQQRQQQDDAQEEKKLEEDDRRRGAPNTPPSPSVGRLREQWQKRDTLIRFKEQEDMQQRKQHPVSQHSQRPSVDSSQQIHQQQDEQVISPSSWLTSREIFDAKRASTAKSEAGGLSSLRGSQMNSLLGSLGNDDSRDAKSDVGTPSPVFANIRLKKTAFSPRNQGRQQVHGQQDDRVGTHAHDPSKAKYSYRERREMELLQKRDEEEAKSASQASNEPPQRDVAALIRRRIAANKNSGFNGDESQHSEMTSGTSSPARKEKNQSRRPDMHVDTETPGTNDVPSAVSRLHMFEQVQQGKQSASTEVASKLIQDGGTIHPRTETPELPGSSSFDKGGKVATPKATMMMLNAFLAGRDSLSSGEAGSNVRGSNSDEQRESDNGYSGSGGAAHDPRNDNPHRIPALKDDPKYTKYFKMLKLGMPMDVVKHAMTRDGLDPSVMDGDHNKPVGVPLKHDPLYTKYFKMLNIGLPMEAVKHAMERDGLDSTVMDQDHDLPVQKQKDEEEEPKEQDSHRRARLHWKPLRKVTRNSLWAKIDQDDELGKIKIDEEEFQELFQVEKASESAIKSGPSPFAPKRGAVRVIDAKRANNGGIILARLKMSHDDMADAVDRINEHALTAEQIENIIEYLPTKDERKALESYMLGHGDAAEKFDALCECEKFMVSMMTVKHAKRKVRALLFKLQFQTCLNDIYNDTVAVEAACDNLCNSVRLRQLMGIVLTFGNRLNTAGNGQTKAGAFTLDSLLKLNQAKAFDKKTTFLHYIVLIVRRNNELLLRFKDDLPNVFKADRIYWDQCVTDLEEVENQLENVRKIALYQARHAMAYRFRRKKREDDEESLSDGEVSLSLEEEVEALRATPIGLFTLSAIKLVSSLRDKVEETKAKYARTLEYFGEDSTESNMQPHELFNTIVAFCRDFDKAKELVFANEKKQQREERKRQATNKAGKTASNQNGGRPPTYSPAQPPERKTMLRASNLQPSMSGVLKELKSRTLPPVVPAVAPAPTRQPQAKNESIDPPVRESVSESSDQFGEVPSDEYSKQASDFNDSDLGEREDSMTSFPTQSNSSSAKASLQEKARNRRHKYAGERSASFPARTPSEDDDDDGAAQPMSPRSSMRARMEQRKLQQRQQQQQV